uniref:PI-PLC X domain-containing protein 1 n=1 Tax=Timema tahoe TaxID=61484 RepID=A0A7R9NYW2_9NEOP|nr:unnamed protein product [Timema tahoe]
MYSCSICCGDSSSRGTFANMLIQHIETVAVSSFSDPPPSSHEEVGGLLANQASVDSLLKDTLVVSPLRDGCSSSRNATTSWATSLLRATACSNIQKKAIPSQRKLFKISCSVAPGICVLQPQAKSKEDKKFIAPSLSSHLDNFCDSEVSGESECGHVFLTLSSLWHLSTHDRGLVDREIELNWETTGCEEELPLEWVELFNTDPHTNTHSDSFISVNTLPPRGHLSSLCSQLSLSDRPVPLLMVKPSNYLEVNSLNCALNCPSQTGQCPCCWQQLGSAPLVSLLIPGTHNSGSHQRGATLTRRDTLAGYLLTQDTDVWGQLVHGIRYLDLRVGYYPPSANKTRNQNHRFWVNHDLIPVGPLIPALRDVKRFLISTKREIVIMDLHRFPVGFYRRPGRHRRLLTLLKKELGSFALPASAYDTDITLEQIWSKNRRLIIAYESTWLWPPLKQLWGDEQTVDGLQEYLSRAMDAGGTGLWAAMAELTPTPLDIMFKPSGSLRHMADSVNRNITAWFRHRWWQHANIVATDYFLGNGIIDVAVSANLRRVALKDGDLHT